MNKISWSALATGCLAIAGASIAQAYTVQDGGVNNGGAISGRVTFNGTAPAPEMLTVDQDIEACGGDRPSQELLVGADGGIQNVVIAIEDIESGKAWNFAQEFVYDQKNCTFVPHVLIIEPRAAGVVKNSDSVGHNFHTISQGIYNTNSKINPATDMAVEANRVRRPGIVRAKCDIHSWMQGWWYVAATPYAELTDASGSFTMSDIPAGTYKVKVWHEKLGETEGSVVVEAGKTAEFNLSMGP